MRKIIILLIVVGLIAPEAMGINNVDVTCDFDIIPPQGYYDPIPLDFEIENDITLYGILMGFEIQATGDLTVHFNGTFQVQPEFSDALHWNIQFIGPMPYDTFLVSAFWMPGDEGLQPGMVRPVLEADIYVEECSFMGEMCIDSCAVAGSVYSWLWTDHASETVSPDFNGGDGAVCLEALPPPCGIMYFTVTPPGDILIGNHCQGLAFEFIAEPPFPEYTITGYSLCPGAPAEASIDDDGIFVFSPGEPGTYPISIRAEGSCPTSEIYDFEVVLINYGLGYTQCPGVALQAQYGDVISYDLGLQNNDCDPIVEGIVIISSPMDIQPSNFPECKNGVFSWLPETGEEGVWEFKVEGTDPYGEKDICQFQVDVAPPEYICGDANSDDAVNVSDAVRIVNFVFIGGDPPDPMETGNVNCDGAVNISDAVWIINYIFVEGAGPCDC